MAIQSAEKCVKTLLKKGGEKYKDMYYETIGLDDIDEQTQR